MKKSDIRNFLEGKSISQKIDLLREYNCENDIIDKQYIIIFLRKESLLPVKNEWYVIEMIDLAAQVKLKDDSLLKRYLSYLKGSYIYYLKLTVLDYVSYMHCFYENDKIDYSVIRTLLENKYERLNVKIQAALTLMLLFPNDKEIYIEQIKKYLKKTEDYRAHIRLYNFIIGMNIEIPVSVIKEFIKITKKKEFSLSKSVQSVLAEINKTL